MMGYVVRGRRQADALDASATLEFLKKSALFRLGLALGLSLDWARQLVSRPVDGNKNKQKTNKYSALTKVSK